jgi:hypothetical protein
LFSKSLLICENLWTFFKDSKVNAGALPLWAHVMTSNAMFKCAGGSYYEGLGVPPDIPVDQDWTVFTDSANPRDTVLEAAIGYLKNSRSSP